MTLIQTADITPSTPFDSSSKKQVYCGLDCCVTWEVFDKMSEEYLRGTNQPSIVYDFARALQAPILEMMLTGIKVDEGQRRAQAERLRSEIELLQSMLDEFARAVWDKPLNPRSPKQLQEFFYGALRIPEIWTSKRGERKLSMDRETLEKLEVYHHAAIFCLLITRIRDKAKELEIPEKEIDPDGRWRSSFNIGGTSTGRLSSSKSSTGTGSNTQNLSPETRVMLVADPGYILVNIDKEQAESRWVGWQLWTLFGDSTYLDACEAGDLHTQVTKLAWTDLPWTGDPKKDREIAEVPFYRHFDRRYMSKKIGHGSNYIGTPWTLSKHAKIPKEMVEDFQTRYFGAFPGVPRWHRWVAQEIQTKRFLITPFGRIRHFFGRPDDDSTLREAVAHVPQSCNADDLNLGLWRVWRHLSPLYDIRLLAQVHDSILFQVPEPIFFDPQGLMLQDVQRALKVELNHNGRTISIPTDVKVGWNWGEWDEKKNPMGMKKFKGEESRHRPSSMEKVW